MTRDKVSEFNMPDGKITVIFSHFEKSFFPLEMSLFSLTVVVYKTMKRREKKKRNLLPRFMLLFDLAL